MATILPPFGIIAAASRAATRNAFACESIAVSHLSSVMAIGAS